MRNPKILVLDRADGLVEQVRGVADDLRPRPDVSVCTRVGSVGDVLTEEGPFDVLIAGPSLGTRAGLARLEVIHDELPNMSLLLAFKRRPEASLREMVRTGAIDLLQLPISDEDLTESVQRAVELSPHRMAAEAPAAAAGAGSSVGGCSRRRRQPAGAARPSSPPTWRTSSRTTPGSEPASSTSTC